MARFFGLTSVNKSGDLPSIYPNFALDAVPVQSAPVGRSEKSRSLWEISTRV
jgi:hypothetical protein